MTVAKDMLIINKLIGTVYPHYVGRMKQLSSDSANENKVKWGLK